MKLLFITGLHPTKKNMMSGIFITRMLKKLQDKGVDFDVYVFRTEEKLVLKLLKMILRRPCNKIDERLTVDNVIYNFLPVKIGIMDRLFFKIRFPLLAKHELIKQIDYTKYDLVHAHWVYPHGYIAYLIKEKHGMPMIISAHGSDIHTNPFKDEKIKRRVVKSLDSANAVIFNSKGLYNTAKKLGYQGKNAKILPIGVDIDLFTLTDKREAWNSLMESREINKTVGFVGNLEWVKGADRLPEIFKQVREQYGELIFIVIGEGSLKEMIEYKCALNNTDVTFPGMVAPNEVPLWMNILDVLVMPSRNEGFGSVAIEAQACGCPVVATNVGGIPEAVGDGGVVIDEGSNYSVEVANAIILMLNSPIPKQILRERAQKYNWSLIAEKQIAVYKEVLHNEGQL